jgi:hypothetical protein
MAAELGTAVVASLDKIVVVWTDWKLDNMKAEWLGTVSVELSESSWEQNSDVKKVKSMVEKLGEWLVKNLVDMKEQLKADSKDHQLGDLTEFQ